MKRILSIIFLTVSLIGYSQKSTDTIGIDASKVNWNLLHDLMIKEVNSERVKLGLPEMIKDSSAMAFVKVHTISMKEKGLYHSNDRTYGECCLQGFLGATLTYEEGAKALISIWKRSTKGHWQILMGDYKVCGVYVIQYEKTSLIPGYPVRAAFVVKW